VFAENQKTVCVCMHVCTSLYIIHYLKIHEKCICEVYTSGKRPGVANDLFDYAKPNHCVLDRVYIIVKRDLMRMTE